jgi:hypothetical protein
MYAARPPLGFSRVEPRISGRTRRRVIIARKPPGAKSSTASLRLGFRERGLETRSPPRHDDGMNPLSLLRLELRSPLVYLADKLPETGAEGFFPPGPMEEGEEGLHLFSPDLLLMGAEGPRLPSPFPRPLSSWKRGTIRLPVGGEAGRVAGGSAPPAVPGPSYTLAEGAWLFMQWRPTTAGELAEGFEWFAREAWWERRPVRGGIALRLVREDRKTACQLLWRLEE